MRIIFLLLLFVFSINCLAQNDSSHAIHIGSDFVVAPIVHFSKYKTFNVAPGGFFHINVNNVIVFKIGALYHLKQYTVIEDKAWLSDTKTTFHYFQKCFQLDLLLKQRKKSRLLLSLGVLSGKGIYSEGIRNNFPIDYLNGENFNLKLGVGYKYGLTKNLYINVEPSFVWFVNRVQSEYYEFGPSPYPAMANIIGTDSQVSLFTMIGVTYDYINLKKKKNRNV